MILVVSGRDKDTMVVVMEIPGHYWDLLGRPMGS